MRLPIILDTDPGIDDAAAIAAALFAPELDLQLMTTVAGNVSVEKTTRNALQLLHFWNADVPLAQGASMPLVRPLRDAASVHGESGMDNDIVPDFHFLGQQMPETVRQVGPLPTVAFNMPSSDFSMTFAGMARHIMSPFADFRPRGNGGFHKTDAVRGK